MRYLFLQKYRLAKSRDPGTLCGSKEEGEAYAIMLLERLNFGKNFNQN